MPDLLFNKLRSDFRYLNFQWKIMCQLYDSGPENIQLLNKSGSNVFRTLQILIIDDVMLNLCRFNDPPKSVGRENVSIRGWLEKNNLPDKKRREVARLLEELKEPMKNIRKARNQRITHNSADVVQGVAPLLQVKYDEIEKSIGCIKYILNKIGDESSNYIPALTSGRDGTKLLQVLARAYEV
jgi:hypothetical protein